MAVVRWMPSRSWSDRLARAVARAAGFLAGLVGLVRR